MTPRESIIPVFVPHLGCPHNCVFCNQNRITGSLQPATPSDVSSAIEMAMNVLPQEEKHQLAFYGGSFTAIPGDEQDALLGAAQQALSEGKINTIRISTRPDAINSEAIDRLRRYGVETVELGAQSLDSDVLIRSGRGHTADDVIKASSMLKNAGFKLIIQMMTGLPGDNDEKCINTAQQIIELKPDGVRIYPTVIIKDTALYELWRHGDYNEHSIEDAVRVCSRIVPMFEEANIPIIRLGLNPTDELSSGAAVAGAYHPALGELVRSRIALNEVKTMLGENINGSSLQIFCNKSKVSQIVGQHRCNVENLKKTYGLSSVKVIGCDNINGISVKIEQ